MTFVFSSAQGPITLFFGFVNGNRRKENFSFLLLKKVFHFQSFNVIDRFWLIKLSVFVLVLCTLWALFLIYLK